jgi:hypothetical protein
MNKTFVPFLGAIVFAGVVFAQATGGLSAISGVVRDATGSVVPNAQVLVVNDPRGFSTPPLVPATGIP